MAGTSGRPVAVVMTGMGEYQSRLIAGMRSVLSEQGFPMIAVCDEPFGAQEGPSSLLLDLIRQRVPVGVIALASAADYQGAQLRAELRRQRIPTVRIGDGDPRTPGVRGDNVSGMIALMAHLLDERKVRRPSLVRGIAHQVDSEARERVFRAELRSRGIEVDEDLIVEGAFRQDITYAVIRDLLGRRRDLDAVVALNDESAMGAMGALIDEGMGVPQTVVVSGFDNLEAAALTWPGLTSVDQNLEEQGAAAARLLLEAMDRQLQEARGDGSPPGQPGTAADPAAADDEPPEDAPTNLVIDSRLVVRGSTSPDKNRILSSWNGSVDQARPDYARLVDGQWMVGLDQAHDELMRAIGMGQSARSLLVSQEAVMGINRAMMHCRTVAEVTAALSSRINRLGIRRCFLALNEKPGSAGGEVEEVSRARLVLAYRRGRPEPPPSEVFDQHRLLPKELRGELRAGLLTLQPLAVADRELGYLLFDAVGGTATLTELLRIDLSRALHTVLSTRELQEHAATLERLVAERTQELEHANQQLQASLMRDGLTRIANRMAFERHLAAWCDPRSRHGGRLALLMVDVDMFKPYNDCYGHLRGDETLRKVASCLAAATRDPEDLACRYGGEEFAVVLPGAGLRGALAVAKRVRDLLAEAAVPHRASPVRSVVTVSIGVAVAAPGCPLAPSSMIRAADQALYRAKVEGRDRVVVADPAMIAALVHEGDPSDDVSVAGGMDGALRAEETEAPTDAGGAAPECPGEPAP